MVISVFGNCDKVKVLGELKKKFGSIKKGEVKVKTFEEAPPKETRIKNLQMDKQQGLLMMAFQSPPLKDIDRFGMEVINAILGAPLSGRMFVKIRDDLGQAYTTNSYYSPDIDKGTFILYVLTKPDKIDSVKHILVQELEDLRIHDVSQQELDGAKSSLKGSLKRSLLTNGALAYTTARDELYGLGYGFYQQYDGQIDAVTIADVRRIANEYLDIMKAAIVVTTPRTVDLQKHE
jgi:zinc protease